MKLKIVYSSNNSGGSWWLGDKDWIALEKSGWSVIWGGKMFCHAREDGWKDVCKSKDRCKGHRKYNSFKLADKDRWLGSVAREAKKEFSGKTSKDCLAKAVEEFERVAGQTLSDEGCNCCGSPHSFEIGEKNTQYISGEDFLEHEFGEESKLTKRDLLKKLKT